jgi:hypothetical protein
MKITARFEMPRLDVVAYRKALAEELSVLITQAAFEWVLAATAEIPVWSGASHATFLHLTRVLGYQLAINEAGNAPRRVNYGLSNSSGSLDIDPGAGQFSFSYETDLKHLVYNEYNNANLSPDPGLFSRLKQPGPYHFQDKARAAYVRATAGLALPDLRRFIKVKIKQVT